jgi:hypothetical protein
LGITGKSACFVLDWRVSTSFLGELWPEATRTGNKLRALIPSPSKNSWIAGPGMD